MFILFVYLLVSMNLLMIKTEGKIVTIKIEAGTCKVAPNVTLVDNKTFTLQVESDAFIKNSHWQHKHHADTNKIKYGATFDYGDALQTLKNSHFSIKYDRNISSNGEFRNTIMFTYSHKQKFHADSGGRWIFTFELLRKYDPWSYEHNQTAVQTCSCNTTVGIDTSSVNPDKIAINKLGADFHQLKSGTPTPQSLINTDDDGKQTVLIVLVTAFGTLFFIQSLYLLYRKLKSYKSNRNNDKDPISPKSPKEKRGRGSKSRRNIADRPPLPLPPDEVVREEPMPSPVSPVPKRHHLFPQASAPPMPVENSYNNHPVGPLVPKQSYRNKGLDTSDERVKSPPFARRQMEDPLVLKQSYSNKGLVNSDEEIRSPGFPRRHMEGPLVSKQSYRNKALVNSDEELKSPGFPRRQGPLVPKKSYRINALVNSDEELKSPSFPRRQEGPLVPKQSYTNKALVNSEEELRSPRFARRQIEAKLAQLPPKGVVASKSFKLPKPLPRSSQSSPPPEKAPAFHPAHRKEPAPPLHPKKLPIYPPPPSAPCWQPDSRMSDVDWQYEKLQPASKYLNNFSDTPYDIMYNNN